jgi:membrane-bound ClpP family serine protease
MGASNIEIFYDIRDALVCVGFLIGIGAGVFLITKKHTTAGILGVIGFLLFSLEPITDFVLFRVIYNSVDYDESLFNTLDLIYPCISAPAIFLGSISLVVALISIARQSQSNEVNAVGLDEPLINK